MESWLHEALLCAGVAAGNYSGASPVRLLHNSCRFSHQCQRWVFQIGNIVVGNFPNDRSWRGRCLRLTADESLAAIPARDVTVDPRLQRLRFIGEHPRPAVRAFVGRLTGYGQRRAVALSHLA